jgi:hypothetical protein
VEAVAAVADEADLAVEAFEAPVGEAEADGGEDSVAVSAQGPGEPDERVQARPAGPCEPGVEVRRGEGRVVEVVEQPELLAQQEGAIQAPVVGLDLGERRELADALALGGLQTSGCP